MSYPKRYVPKRLTRKDKRKQKREINKSRKAYKKGKYYTRKKVKSFKSKESAHVTKAKKIYGVENISANAKLAKKTGCSIGALSKIIKKGQGAYYSSGSRPNQTGHSWGRARLASSITGGKAAAVDFNILESGCKSGSKALRLAKSARKRHGYGTRRVPKHKGGTSQVVNPVNRVNRENRVDILPEDTRVRVSVGEHVNDTGTVFSVDNNGIYEVYLDHHGGEVLFSRGELEVIQEGGSKRKTRKKRSTKMHEKILKFERGPGEKKYTAHIKDKKTGKVRVLHFGHKDYEQFKDRTKNGLYSSRNHGNKKRQRNYYNRHSGEKNRKKAIEKEKRKGNGYYTPKLLSHIYLW